MSSNTRDDAGLAGREVGRAASTSLRDEVVSVTEVVKVVPDAVTVVATPLAIVILAREVGGVVLEAVGDLVVAGDFVGDTVLAAVTEGETATGAIARDRHSVLAHVQPSAVATMLTVSNDTMQLPRPDIS